MTHLAFALLVVAGTLFGALVLARLRLEQRRRLERAAELDAAELELTRALERRERSRRAHENARRCASLARRG